MMNKTTILLFKIFKRWANCFLLSSLYIYLYKLLKTHLKNEIRSRFLICNRIKVLTFLNVFNQIISTVNLVRFNNLQISDYQSVSFSFRH